MKKKKIKVDLPDYLEYNSYDGYEIEIPIYNYIIQVIKSDILKDCVDGFVLDSGFMSLLVLETDDIGVLIHECYHLFEHIENKINQKLEGEAGAYLISYITSQIIEAVNKLD